MSETLRALHLSSDHNRTADVPDQGKDPEKYGCHTGDQNVHRAQENVQVMVKEKDREAEEEQKHRETTDAGSDFTVICFLRQFRAGIRNWDIFLIGLQGLPTAMV